MFDYKQYEKRIYRMEGRIAEDDCKTENYFTELRYYLLT